MLTCNVLCKVTLMSDLQDLLLAKCSCGVVDDEITKINVS